jgi:sarcosine oxidase, subunit gamma
MLSQLPATGSLIRVQSWTQTWSSPVRAEQLLGVQWPRRAGSVATGRADVICIGPADWLVVSATGVEADESGSGRPLPSSILEALESALCDSTFRVTDLSSALARIRIEAAYTPALLSKVCALDLSTELMPGCAPRTLVAGIPVVVRCLEATVFDCIVPLSYSDYLMSWLSDASAEFTVNE